ncbi:27054_t:CDS:2, partial [Dentiscutata erythropus]
MSYATTSNIVDGNVFDNKYIINDDDQAFSDSEYFVTFKCNKHNETIIDHVIDNDDMNEDLFVLEEQDGTTDSEYEPSLETTHKRNKKNRNNIGACRTVRTNLSKFPKELKISNVNLFNWNTLNGMVMNDVLTILWINNGPVTMLTTIHEAIDNDWKVIRNRRHPRTTSSNANKVYQVFGNLSQKELAILCVINDYNNFMGDVDLADQLRGYYNCQLTVCHTWFPLFFWLLDTVLVNCIILYRKASDTDTKITSKNFRIALIWSLIQE